jgi:SAM-dependent methyltransferase
VSRGVERIAYEPELVPPIELMRTEGIDVLEEWFRWGEEWSVLLRTLAGVGRRSAVLEIGCGLGRVAFPLRFVLLEGSYDGFEIVEEKVRFLHEGFAPRYPAFKFVHADVRNSEYNPDGRLSAASFSFPYDAGRFDVVFAASVFTHLLPENAENYFREAARVLRPGGRCLFSLFLLDHYDPGRPRPLGFARSDFDFTHRGSHLAEPWAAASRDNPERMTAYGRALVEALAREAGLELVGDPVPGLWSGAFESWAGAQDLVLLRRAA